MSVAVKRRRTNTPTNTTRKPAILLSSRTSNEACIGCGVASIEPYCPQQQSCARSNGPRPALSLVHSALATSRDPHPQGLCTCVSRNSKVFHSSCLGGKKTCAFGWTRTFDTRFRKPALCWVARHRKTPMNMGSSLSRVGAFRAQFLRAFGPHLTAPDRHV